MRIVGTLRPSPHELDHGSELYPLTPLQLPKHSPEAFCLLRGFTRFVRGAPMIFTAIMIAAVLRHPYGCRAPWYDSSHRVRNASTVRYPSHCALGVAFRFSAIANRRS
jgi:hypothetical protein